MAALGLLKFTAERLAAPSVVVAIVVLLGGGAVLAAGVTGLRATPGEEPAAPADPAPLVLGLGATALAGIALFVNYDGFSSLWVELQEGESAEFFLEPAIAAAGILISLLLLGARPRLATGLLLAIGTATALHYLGLLVAAWRAIGEVGQVRSAGFVGVLGGLLALAAGASAYRVQRASRDKRP